MSYLSPECDPPKIRNLKQEHRFHRHKVGPVQGSGLAATLRDASPQAGLGAKATSSGNLKLKQYMSLFGATDLTR